MALPSFDELRRAYESIPGIGEGIQEGTQGYMKGAELADVINQRRQTAALKRGQFKNAVAEHLRREKETTADVGLKEAKTASLLNPNDTSVYGMGEGGKLDLLGSVPKGSQIRTIPQGIGSPLAMSRLAQIQKSPDITRSKNIIERGQRIEKLLDPEAVVQSPGVLALAQQALDAQSRGGVASVAGVRAFTNETAAQYLARIVEKVKNAPQDASTDAFRKQVISISRRETLAAAQALQGNQEGLAEAAAAIYDKSNPQVASEIRRGAKSSFRKYLTLTLGRDTPATDTLSPEELSDLINPKEEGESSYTSDDFRKEFLSKK